MKHRCVPYLLLVLSVGLPAAAQDLWFEIGDIALHHVDGFHKARAVSEQNGAIAATDFEGLPGAAATTRVEPGGALAEYIVTQHAQSPKPGLWGVQWGLRGIPLHRSIIVPGRSGVKLEQGGPGGRQTFDYPMGWEVQFVIVEDRDMGFWVWAEDPEGRFKRLVVDRTPSGWNLTFVTLNHAPFDNHTSCDSVRWRIAPYRGDWRHPARQYRDWAEAHFAPTPIAQQEPGWIADIRCVAIMGMDIGLAEALAKRLDPRETMIYVPSWRKAGYDRDYPVYDEPFEQLAPFLDRAHALGYRVMLHVNYFGCDPLNPLYEQFEPYQVRSPWGNHDKEWWLWERADPVIKFAYINPAHKPWRDLFVARMTQLCTDYAVDALHIDQTLCIYNDHNGLMDGVTMAQGNILLHKELRAALPHVAISGEGLNEITYRHEAFAQRHAWGLYHSEGTYDRVLLETAHPVCAYVLGPYTQVYGYLGYAPPASGALYAAWNEAYEHWGVIPTIKPDANLIDAPTGFTRQFYDEAAFWFRAHPIPDLEGPWPPDVAFPFITADAGRAVRTTDHVLRHNGREISRTITGCSRAALPGSIPGWRAYGEEGLFGLDPTGWYPYFTDAPDPEAFHVAAMPEGAAPRVIAATPRLGTVRAGYLGRVVVDFTKAIVTGAVCSSEPKQGAPVVCAGPLYAADGAHFRPSGDALHAHPPWKTPGSGLVRARFELDLPDAPGLRFVSKTAIDKTAAGRGETDGVVFGLHITADGVAIAEERQTASAEPVAFNVDLSPAAGRHVQVDLTVHAGPEDNPSYDWARWHAPRIECDAHTSGPLTVVSPHPYTLAVGGAPDLGLRIDGNRYTMTAPFPGAVFLLPELPPQCPLPLDVAQADFITSFANDAGQALEAPRYGCAVPQETCVGGATRPGLFCHPPDYGRTCVDLPLTLPDTPAEFHAFVGLRDGSESTGAVFIVEMNGVELARARVTPGAWHELAGDLSRWAGRPGVLSLITDADGPYICDWAHWGEPVIRPAT